MDIHQQLHPLELFNEKFEELSQSGFIKNWEGKRLSYSFDLNIDELEQTIPSDDELKSFILTLRFFIQDNEQSSLRNLEKHYKKLPLSSSHLIQFEISKAKLNEYLNFKTHFGKTDKSLLTHRDIFDNYIYGHFAHSNSIKREQVKKWNKSSLMGSQTKFFFITILFNLFFLLKKIRNVNDEAIQFLRIK